MSQLTSSLNSLDNSTLNDLAVQTEEEYLGRLASSSLGAYCLLTTPKYLIAPHHALMIKRLEKLASRTGKRRLAIFMPPRHGKSETVNRNFISWYLGCHPKHEVIGASYNHDLAQDFGREIRNKFKSREHLLAFPNVELRSDSHAADRWNTNWGGGYRAAGMDTGVTGRGAHLLVIDDPHKGRVEADSKSMRDKVLKTYKSDFYTRLEDDALIVLCMTRWHHEDLAASMLEMEDFDVVDFPAVLDDGGVDPATGKLIGWTKALWPEKKDIPELKQIRKVLGLREWSALYMQRPTPEEGAFFSRKDVRRWATIPQGLSIYASSDYAVKDKGGDYTVHCIIGVDHALNYYLLDMWRGKTNSGAWIEAMLTLMRRYKPLVWFGEKGVIQHAVEPFLAQRMQATKTFTTLLHWVPSLTDKASRAMPLRSAMQAGAFYLPPHQWADVVIEEMMTFPAGHHDDIVDTLGQFVRGLAMVAPGFKPLSAHAEEERNAAREPRDYRRQQQGSLPSWKAL